MTRECPSISYYASTWHPTDPGRRPPDWEAYVTFQDAFYTMLRWVTWDRDPVARADSLFRRVIALDPGYDEAYLLLGEFVFMQQRPTDPRAMFYQRGRPAAMDSLVKAMRNRATQTDLGRLIANHREAFVRADYGSMLRWAQEIGRALPSRPHVGTLFAAGAGNRPRAALEQYGVSSYDAWVFDVWLAWFWLAANYHLAGDYQGEADAIDSAYARPHLRYVFSRERLRAQAALGNVDRVRELTTRLDPGLAYLGALELRAHGIERENDSLLAESDRLVRWVNAWYDEAPDQLLRKLYAYWTLSLDNRLDEVVAYLEPMVRDSSHLVDVKGMLGAAYAMQGDTAAAERIDGELAAEDPEGLRGLHTLWRARIAARLGLKEKAVQLLDQALREGTWFQPLAPVDGAFWHTDPHFEGLRGDPAYEQVIAPR